MILATLIILDLLTDIEITSNAYIVATVMFVILGK